MNRRHFFSKITAFLGFAAAPSVVKIPPLAKNLINPVPADLAMDPCVFVYKSKAPDVVEKLYGKNFVQNLQALRNEYFKTGQLLALSKVSRMDPVTKEVQRFVVLNFDSSSSKDQYLKDHSKVYYSSRQNSFMTPKA